MLDRLEQPERLGLRVDRDLGEVLHRRSRDARPLERGEPVGRVPRAEALLDDRRELVPVRAAVGVRAEAHVLGQLGRLEHLAERLVEPVVARGHHDPAVARLERLVRGDHPDPGALRLGHPAAREVADQLEGQPRDGRLVERRVDELGACSRVTRAKGGEDADHGPHRRPLVDHGDAAAHRRPLGRFARDRHDPARGLHQGVVARLLGERADAAERADRAVDQPVVAGLQRLEAEAQALAQARAHVLDEDVRAVEQLQHHLEPGRVLHVERERPLARVDAQEGGRLAVPERRPPRARVVAALRVLDLHDLRAERGERLGAERACDRRREVDDPDPCERAEHLLRASP
ncbi:MAG: hypothetical protein R3C15_13685 [Thermoleophilia bacterium]